MESVLRHHHAHDEEFGLDSVFLPYFEQDTPPIPRVHSLDIRPAIHGIRDTRRIVAAAVGPEGLDVAIYHGLWGFKFLCPADTAKRRVLLAHGGAVEFEGMLSRSGKWLDGAACVSDRLLQRVRNTLPGLGRDRLERVFTPIHIPQEKPRLPLEGRPIVIGYAGRVTVDAKRSDRLGPLYRALKKTGLPFKLEILGDGDDLDRLKQELKGVSEVVFQGTKTGREYSDILNSWDIWISLSDSEGTPLSLLEALGLGCVPIFPKINTGGDAYVEAVDPGFLYPRGEIESAVRIIQTIAATPKEGIRIWQERGRAGISAHTNGDYLPRMASFIRRVDALPRISTAGWPGFPPVLDRLTLNQLGGLVALARKIITFPSRSRA